MSEEVERLKARIREIERALRPFAEESGKWQERTILDESRSCLVIAFANNVHDFDDYPMEPNTTIAPNDFIRAARALKGEA